MTETGLDRMMKSALPEIRVAVVSRNYFNMPLWVGVHRGFFEDEGLNVKVEIYEGVDEVSNRLYDSRVQLAYGITEHVILDSEGGGDSVIIAGNVNRLPFSLIGGRNIRNFEDMRGKVVGVSSLEAGSSSLVMKLFEAHDLQYPADYTMSAVGPILSRWEKLQSGEIQAGLQGAPLNYIARDAGFVTLADPRIEFPDFQFTSLNALSRWANENRNVVVRFLGAFIKAHEWFFANKEEATDIAVQETGIERKYAEQAWEEYTQEQIFPINGDASDAAVQALIDISGLIRALPQRTKTKASDYIDRSYINEAWTLKRGLG